ncbi:putative redox-active protein [bacterium BMS3Abin10]|nr:putative redox-active protein [bacterium BMS3Abin10]GBE37926.1 putative redox-active protein [bacterium BMS3Bbin08]
MLSGVIILIMGKADSAVSLFKKGLNCAQSLLLVYGTELGMDNETALRIATAFGSGMGKMGETCGAVTGAFMIIGLRHGTAHSKDRRSKSRTYELVERFVEKFKARNNTIVCRELVGADMGTPGVGRIIMQKCPKYVHDSAELIEEILEIQAGETVSGQEQLHVPVKGHK